MPSLKPEQIRLERQYQAGRQQLLDIIVPLMCQEPDPEDDVRPLALDVPVLHRMMQILRPMDIAASEAFSVYSAPLLNTAEGERPHPSDDAYFASTMVTTIIQTISRFDAERHFWLQTKGLLTCFLLYGAITALPEQLFALPEEDEEEGK